MSTKMQVKDSADTVGDLEKIAREDVKRLNVEREALEAEADAIVSELRAPLVGDKGEEIAPMGVDTPLVDKDGYPRGDIDVYRARTLRNRLAIIRTDHKNLMKRLEAGLAQVAAFAKASQSELDEAEERARAAPKPRPKYDPVTGKWVVMNWDGSVSGVEGGEERDFHNLTADVTAGGKDESKSETLESAMESMEVKETKEEEEEEENAIAFALVDGVAPDSPASSAGLQEGDWVVQFGSHVNYANHRNLKAIAELVPTAAANGAEIPIQVLRRDEDAMSDGDAKEKRKLVTVNIVPRPWAGRGLLGCHIVPYSPPSK